MEMLLRKGQKGRSYICIYISIHIYPSSTTFPTFFPHFNQPTSTKTQVPTQIFFYFESRKFSTCLCIPDPDAFSKITWFSGKNGGHVLSRNSCWREWIPLPFSKKFNFFAEPIKYIYIDI